MLSFLQTAVAFVLVLTLVVTIHELGHFWAAKSFGVAIDRFSIGFGKAIASWTDKSGVQWRIGWAPVGGYVAFSGDDNAASVPDQDDLETMRQAIVAREGQGALSRYFHFKPIWQRAVIAAAGPMANFVLAIVIFAVLIFALGENLLPAKVASVAPGSPAAAAGFRPGDLIAQADGRPVKSFMDLAEVAQLRVNLPTEFVVRRGTQEVSLIATSKLQMRSDGLGGERMQGTLGIVPAQAREDYVHVRYNPIEAVGKGVERTWRVLSTTVYYLGRMVTGQVSADQLSGPLGIARVSGQVAQAGAVGAPDLGSQILGSGVALLGLAAVLSVGIGFMNLLPVPVLDGGHLLFYAYEAVARRPLAAKVQAAGYRVGLALLLGLMLFATWNDLQQLRVFKILGGLLS
ncbi:MAG: M50 family metallopeptidase [Phenylobacterium sp.]|uniref:M50 family metallopeptidase n=1 Tax=Phenylobacterium sp. TaxID=1871053 RepID=UPI003BB64C25